MNLGYWSQAVFPVGNNLFFMTRISYSLSQAYVSFHPKGSYKIYRNEFNLLRLACLRYIHSEWLEYFTPFLLDYFFSPIKL